MFRGNQTENNKGEKRHSAGGDAAAPKAKRPAVAVRDLNEAFSNVLLDSTKPPLAQKSRLLNVKPLVDPCPDFDFDKHCGKDIRQVTEYANDIFNYYRHRQEKFKVKDYLKTQRDISGDRRAILVDWLVLIHELIELNHESLYLAVKITDIYLSRTTTSVQRGDLQLLGGAALFLASKYDERVSPRVDDILYLCDNNYTSDQIIKMELLLFKVVGFDLGIPLSYRFLRRFARVIHLEVHTLTLARYILETSLMFYVFVGIKDDLMAAASLLLALRMKNLGDWNVILVKYTGYSIEEVEPLMKSLNHMIIKRCAEYGRLDNTYKKYSDQSFFEVTKIPSLDDDFVLADPIAAPTSLSFH